MARRKDYSLEAAPKRAPVVSLPAQQSWVVVSGGTEYDLSRWRYHGVSGQHAGRDELVAAVRAALDRMARFSSPKSIRSLCRGGLPPWFQYLDHRLDQHLSAVCRLSDISREVLEEYAVWLRHRPAKTKSGRHSYSGARTAYSQSKSIWLECIAAGSLSMECIPDNPFPNSNRAAVSHKPYSKGEMRRLLASLAADLTAIRGGAFRGGQSDRLLVYLLLIAARTGRNPTPLFELSREALQPHPIKPETHALLTTYKRRGNNIAIQSLRNTQEIEEAATIAADVATLFYEVREMTEQYVKDAPRELRTFLWLFERDKRGAYGEGISSLNSSNCHDAIGRFVARHNLTGDEIDPATGETKSFQVTFMRLRKTFASRMWQLTGGDLVRTANALGNQPHVTDTHYLAVTPEMVRNHRFVGKCLEADLRGKTDDPATVAGLANEIGVSVDDVRRILAGKNNTGVGRCSSPLYGKFAPQTGGKACTAFLYCFRCPNQVVMESDLYRLFSFYWLLIKERNILMRNRWHKVYGWVIREIDQVISPRFPPDRVRQAREEARLNPHPMWRDRAMLGGAHG
ncbi:hypothetical protein [Dechloromonas sp. ZS-1]|uniref:hypothetical protein n=1 Tax=Dechloromonas sp. ZS-1 TaxID=3138067 RepID=UPI0031FDC324